MGRRHAARAADLGGRGEPRGAAARRRDRPHRAADAARAPGSMSEETIYSGRVVTLRLKHLALASGRTVMREVVEHAAGAAVVAVDADGQVLLVRQHRPAVDAFLLELPAGLVDPGES